MPEGIARPLFWAGACLHGTCGCARATSAKTDVEGVRQTFLLLFLNGMDPSTQHAHCLALLEMHEHEQYEELQAWVEGPVQDLAIEAAQS
jgi:hypothetical protein